MLTTQIVEVSQALNDVCRDSSYIFVLVRPVHPFLFCLLEIDMLIM